MSEWKEVKLEDIAKVNLDSLNKSFPYETIHYIDISSVGSGELKEFTKIPISKAPSRAKRLVKPNDVLLSTVRPKRRSFLFLKNPDKQTVVSTGFAVLRALDNVHPRFLYYAISNPAFTNYLVSREKGAAYPAVSVNDLKEGIILLPGFDIQNKIVSILGAIDDKIELNHQMNETLEEMAVTLYKHWFVDFGPFQDGEFVESELGKIPEGWKVSSLDNFVNIKNKSINPKKVNEGKTLIHFSIPALEMNYPYFEKASDIKSNKYAIENNSILLSKLNPRFYRIWTVYKDEFQDGLPVCSTEFIVYEPKLEIDWSFLNAYLRSNIFIDKFRSHASGTTGSRQRVTPKITLDFNTVEPPEYIREQFNDICKPYWDLIHKNTLEIQTLKETRDYLLPKLLSGKIDLSEVEKEVEQVL